MPHPSTNAVNRNYTTVKEWDALVIKKEAQSAGRIMKKAELPETRHAEIAKRCGNDTPVGNWTLFMFLSC
jgi:hypothetical protein